MIIFVVMKIKFERKDKYVGRFVTAADIILSVIFTTALMWILCVRGGLNVVPAVLIIVLLDVIFLALRLFERERKSGMSHINSIIDERIDELQQMKWDDPLNGDIYQEEIDMLKDSKDELNKGLEEQEKKNDK